MDRLEKAQEVISDVVDALLHPGTDASEIAGAIHQHPETIDQHRADFHEITLAEFFMGRDKTFADQLTPDIIANATATVGAWNRLLAIYCKDTNEPRPDVRSGWRPPAVNAKTPGAATNSQHMTGRAGDMGDSHKKLAEWVKAHPEICSECGLWFEDPFSIRPDGSEFTPTWVHGQIVPPRSGRRFYIPA